MKTKKLNQSLRNKIKVMLPVKNIFFNEPLWKYTSFKLGGPAECFLFPSSIEELRNIIFFANENNIPFFIIGEGSNILVSDTGLEGFVIKLSKGIFNTIKLLGGNRIKSYCGVALKNVSLFTAKQGLQG